MAAGGYAYLHGGRFVSTDNAYVGAQKVLITPEISGKVSKIRCRKASLSPGDELLEIDRVLPDRGRSAQATSPRWRRTSPP